MTKKEHAKPKKSETVAILYSTFPNAASAAEMASYLVSEHLVACVNVLPGMMSYYWWDGHLTESEEAVALFKTTKKRAEAVKEAIRARHPYTSPAILVLPVDGGDQEFLSWIAGSVKGKQVKEASRKAQHAGKKVREKLAKPVVLADTLTEKRKLRAKG